MDITYRKMDYEWCQILVSERDKIPKISKALIVPATIDNYASLWGKDDEYMIKKTSILQRAISL